MRVFHRFRISTAGQTRSTIYGVTTSRSRTTNLSSTTACLASDSPSTAQRSATAHTPCHVTTRHRIRTEKYPAITAACTPSTDPHSLNTKAHTRITYIGWSANRIYQLLWSRGKMNRSLMKRRRELLSASNASTDPALSRRYTNTTNHKRRPRTCVTACSHQHTRSMSNNSVTSAIKQESVHLCVIL